MIEFKGDVLLESTIDGGDIILNDYNLIESTGGFETAIYLTLFGGNEFDDGTENNNKYTWWGNHLEDNNPERRIISRTQNILIGLPAVPANLLRLEEAIKLDMAWFKDEKIIDTLNINLSIPSKNRVNISLEGMKDKTQLFNLKYQQNWLAKIG